MKDKYGYLDKNGKEIISIKYDYASSFEEGLARVKFKNKYGVINKKGKVVIPIKYDYLDGFYDGIAEVKKDGKYGFINKDGKQVIPIKYDYIPSTVNNETSDYSYDNTTVFKDGLAIVYLNKGEKWKCGIIDESGNIVLPIEYNNISLELNNGIIYVEKDGVIGILDKNFSTKKK